MLNYLKTKKNKKKSSFKINYNNRKKKKNE